MVCVTCHVTYDRGIILSVIYSRNLAASTGRKMHSKDAILFGLQTHLCLTHLLPFGISFLYILFQTFRVFISENSFPMASCHFPHWHGSLWFHTSLKDLGSTIVSTSSLCRNLFGVLIKASGPVSWGAMCKEAMSLWNSWQLIIKLAVPSGLDTGGFGIWSRSRHHCGWSPPPLRKVWALVVAHVTCMEASGWNHPPSLFISHCCFDLIPLARVLLG